MNIYVANLNFDLQDEDLKKFFIPYGEVSSARIIMDKGTDRSRGFGFVEMADDTAARKAITELDGNMVDGRPMKVNEAKPKPERSFGGGGNGSGGGRGDGGYNNSKSYNQTRY
jgi:RNA recognition motif-containing protein